jgi:RHS repeat-associated protein
MQTLQSTAGGQRLEDDIGLYYYGARWYDPSIMRFVQPDTEIPQSQDPQVLDRSIYAGNNPIKYTDQSGHCWGIASGLRGLPIYNITCQNLDMALSIVQNPNANFGEKLLAEGYIALEATAHAGLVVGTTGLVCAATVPGCAKAVETVLGIGTAACADGNCTNELNAAIKLGDISVEKISSLDKITSQLMSKSDLLGIQKIGNMSDLSNPQVQKGLDLINDITSNPASRIWQGTWHGQAVYEYILNGIGVIRDRATGELISIVSRSTNAEFQLLQEFVDIGTAEWIR